jgi:hypothetical protein
MCVEGEGSGPAFRYQWLLRGTVRNDRNTSPRNRSPIAHQIRVGNWSYLPSDVCVQKLWKAFPFAIECTLIMAVNTRQKNFTESVIVRRHTEIISKCIRSGRRLKNRSELKLHSSHGKWNVKMASRTSKIVLVLSELHNSCSYLEERSKIGTSIKRDKIIYCLCFLKMHMRKCVQIIGVWTPWEIRFIRPVSNICSINISV